MAATVRTRAHPPLSWVPECEEERVRRREALCELDGLLMELEEANLRGRHVPIRVLISLRRHGVAVGPRLTAADLIESVFAVQEAYMRQLTHPRGIDASRPRRRVA